MPGRPTDAEVYMAHRILMVRRLAAAGLLLAASAGLAFPVPPSAPSPDSCPAIDPPATAASPERGIRVFVDPATGRLRRPTPEERRRIALSSRDRSGRTYEVMVRPDGTRIVKLDETFLMSVVATRNPDGTMSYSCRNASAAPQDDCPAEDSQ
jgi:hypothetical protein